MELKLKQVETTQTVVVVFTWRMEKLVPLFTCAPKCPYPRIFSSYSGPGGDRDEFDKRGQGDERVTRSIICNHGERNIVVGGNMSSNGVLSSMVSNHIEHHYQIFLH